MQRHILNHLLALFQLALPPRIDLPDDVSLENSSRVDAETTRDALDVDFDMIDSEYFDQEYTTPLGSIQESIREASSDDLPLAQRDSYGGPTTDYILKGFVKDKLIFEIPHEISLLRPLVTNATLAMIDVVTMVSKALGSLIQPDEDQNRIALEIDLLFDALKDFHNCSNEFLVGARKNLGSLFTSPTLEDSSISLMSRLHGTLWALACNLGLVSRREQIGNKYNMETFQVFISTVQRSRVHISRLLTGDESGEQSSSSK